MPTVKVEVHVTFREESQHWMPDHTPEAYTLQHLRNTGCCGYIRPWDAIFGNQALGTVAVDRPASHQSADMYTACSCIQEPVCLSPQKQITQKYNTSMSLKPGQSTCTWSLSKHISEVLPKTGTRTKASLVLLLPSFPDNEEILWLVKQLESPDLSSLVS